MRGAAMRNLRPSVEDIVNDTGKRIDPDFG
jgi:hypothetical protein